MKCPDWKEKRHILREDALRWAAALYTLNIFDMLFTLFFLLNGIEEGNPAMAALWALDPWAFLSMKLFGMAFLVYGIHSLMRKPWHSVALKALTITYLCLVCYHVWGLCLLVFVL